MSSPDRPRAARPSRLVPPMRPWHPIAWHAGLTRPSQVQEQFVEACMSKDVMPGNRPVADHLHPLIYAAIVGLALWLVLSVWGFAGGYYTDFVLAVVSAFVLLALAILYVLWRVGRRDQAADAAARSDESGRSEESIGHWLSGEFNTWQDRVKATNAAIEIL